MKIQEEFARELIPGETYYFNYKNKTVSGKFKRATKAWKIFEDDNGNEMYINSWSNVATTPEDIEGVERVVDAMEKDTKLPSHIPNRETKAPNRHGFVESNELEKRAKKHKKKQKGLPMNGLNPNAGNVEINNKVFNAMNNVTNSPSTNPTGPMGEEMTKLEAMTCLNRLNEEDSNERDFAIYCNNAFGKYKVANWKATDAETAVAEFKELNPKYTKTGLITAVEI
jgi:hypothetical protein